MKVLILQEFDGYPNGDDKAPVTFRVSETAVEVADEFGKMIIDKGHAKAADGGKKPAKPAPGDA